MVERLRESEYRNPVASLCHTVISTNTAEVIKTDYQFPSAERTLLRFGIFIRFDSAPSLAPPHYSSLPFPFSGEVWLNRITQSVDKYFDPASRWRYSCIMHDHQMSETVSLPSPNLWMRIVCTPSILTRSQNPVAFRIYLWYMYIFFNDHK